MEEIAPRLPGSPLAPPAAPAFTSAAGTPFAPPPQTPARIQQAVMPLAAPSLPTPTPSALFFDAAPPSPWASAEVPAAFAAPAAAPAFLGATPALASPLAPPVPAPPVPAPPAPAPVHSSTVPMPVGPPVLGGPHSQHGGGPAPVALAPIPMSKKSRGPFMAVVALVAIVAVGVGAFMVLRGGADERLTDVSTVVVPDPAPDDSADFSFSTATAQAQAAGSMMIEFSAETPEGPVTAVIAVDRASRRMSAELDLSQMVPTDDDFIEMPDSYTMILDQDTATVYMSSEVLGGFMDVGTAWLSTSTTVDDGIESDNLEEIFANPFDIAHVLGGADPVDLGIETIEGEELRHYRVTTDADGVSAEEQPGSKPSLDSDEIEYDVWVTQDSEIRRIEYDFYDDGDELRFVMTVRASVEAVDIALPDPADVTDFEAVFDMDAEFKDDTTTIDGGAVDQSTDVVED